MKRMLPILIKQDARDGYIFVCPHCHQYVVPGVNDICERCHAAYDKNIVINYFGKVNYD